MAKATSYVTLSSVPRDRMPRLLLLGLAAVAILWLALLLASRLPASRPTPFAPSPLRLPDGCTLTMAHQLTVSGIPGEVGADDSGLRVSVPHALPEGTPPDEEAQTIWAVFDAAMALPPECAFRQLTVQVRTDAGVCLRAHVADDDLRAWHTGELNDDEFIERVTYTQEPCSPSSP